MLHGRFLKWDLRATSLVYVRKCRWSIERSLSGRRSDEPSRLIGRQVFLRREEDLG
jgi:hypothetical protein